MRFSEREKDLLENNGQLETVELLLPDINGLIRGKRIPIDQLEKVYGSGVCLPGSLFGTDITGNTVEATGLGFVVGDEDKICRPVFDSLVLQSWEDNKRAQLLLNMFDKNGKAFELNPRVILEKIVKKFKTKKLTPVIAVELEFYLYQTCGENGPRVIEDKTSGKSKSDTQVYYLDDLEQVRDFVEEVEERGKELGLSIEAVVAEYAPGQFEINLKYRDDGVKACDDAIYLKQLVKAIAKKHEYYATFMAKPYSEYSGSGMHIHTSVLDAEGDNIFASKANGISKSLKQAIAGMQQSFFDFMLVFAPHVNSYHRFQQDSFVPLYPCWGRNNRTVALRIPLSDEANTRIEHRVAGADANPYLVCAAVLAGIYQGFENQLKPTVQTKGDATLKNTKLGVDLNWYKSLEEFSNSSIVKQYFGAKFQKHYFYVKREEQNKLNQSISPLEYDWYLTQV